MRSDTTLKVCFFLLVGLNLFAGAVGRRCSKPLNCDCKALCSKSEYPPKYCNCNCDNRCLYETCPPGQTCVLQHIECFRAPCYSIPECQDTNSCDCQQYCSGSSSTSRSCPNCDCENPCSYTTCPAGEVCKQQVVECFTTPCYPQPQCKEECNRFCTMDFNPVCGTDGQTYGNPCALATATCESDGAVTQAYAGECNPCPLEGPPSGSCPSICTMDYTPVCGTDNVTYGNCCGLQDAHFCGNSDVAFAYAGECNPVPT